MKQRVLGRSGLATSPVGLGCTSLSDAYGPADEAESVRTIHRALDLGVTLLDTGSSYGDGENERLVGRIGAMAELAAAARTGRNPLGRGEVWGYGRAMAEWWSIEVFDGAFPARPWKDAHSSSLIESAISNGAVDWVWHEHRWGVVLEVAFGSSTAGAAAGRARPRAAGRSPSPAPARSSSRSPSPSRWSRSPDRRRRSSLGEAVKSAHAPVHAGAQASSAS